MVFPEVNEKLAAAELAAITPLFCSGGAKYIGKAEDALWAKSQDLLSEVKLLPAGQDPKTLLHQRLPAAGVRDARVQVATQRETRSAWATNDDSATRTPTCTSACRSAVPGGRSPMRTSSPSPASPATTRSCTRATSTRKSSQFGRRVAHGMLGLAYAHGLMWAAHRRTARDGDRVPRHQRLEVRRADLHRRHDLRRTTASPSCATASRSRRRRSRRSTSRSSTRTSASCSAGRKALLVSKVPLAAVEASARRGATQRDGRSATSHDAADAKSRRADRDSAASSKTFGEDTDKPFLALKEVSVDIAGRRVRLGRRAVGLRQEHADADGRGAARAQSAATSSIGGAVGDASRSPMSASRSRTTCCSTFAPRSTTSCCTRTSASCRRKKIEARAKELFAQLRLTQAMDKYPRQLSGGMRQRVSLIRTLVHDPSLLLMDEPFGALDALTRLQVRTDLEALWLRRRPTVLFITHSVEEAVGLSDRILVMGPSPGEVVEEIRVDLPRPRPIVLGDVPGVRRLRRPHPPPLRAPGRAARRRRAGARDARA